MSHLSGTYYYGSKARPELHKWIISHLPEDYELYAEPFAGMLGVLLNRSKASTELVNDLDGRIINWWLVIRDKAEELYKKLQWTPYSEKVYYDCFDTLDEGTDVERALKFTIVTTAGRMHSTERRFFSYRTSGTTGPASGKLVRIEETLFEVRKRIRRVVFAERPAEELLKRLAREEHAVIYCDPPYATADTSLYKVDERDNLADLFSQQKGKVAISGYNDEWDELGWERHEMEVSYAEGIKGKKQPKKTEVLWTNYNAGSQLTLTI